MIPRAVHRYPRFNLTAEETPGKSQLGDRLMKVMRPVNSSNGIPYLQNEVAQQVREGKDGKDRIAKFATDAAVHGAMGCGQNKL